jgi:hypothetical protein
MNLQPADRNNSIVEIDIFPRIRRHAAPVGG